ncbi:hypothetical protein L204_101373 [Cryptococcus depauperatus]|nr:hypothetical protein L204_04043 [Cryptococcus depauperatus CBS 7855]
MSFDPFTTPTKRTAFSSTEVGLSRPRPSGASPAYSSRRHSLYGIEDRVVLDLGSRIWKVGFSGEPEPRAVFLALDSSSNSTEAWDLDIGSLDGARKSRSEGNRLAGVRIANKLKETFVKHLLADSKQRKVIVTENTFLPTYIKEHIARVLFDNLRVPSVSFTPASILALASCGRVTGLVVDIGWLETSVTPVYNSRPLFSLSRSTPLAGKKLHTRVKSLLYHEAIYISPPISLSNLARERRQGVPADLLNDSFVERVITEGCFVGSAFIEPEEKQNVEMEVDFLQEYKYEIEDPQLLHTLRKRYQPSSSASDMVFSVDSSGHLQRGHGTVIVPGWAREQAAEVLFDDDDETEGESVPHAILNTLLKLPIDLRSELASSILIIGGVSSLPNLIPRLRTILLQSLLPFSSTSEEHQHMISPLNTPAANREEARAWRKRTKEPYRRLHSLVNEIAILNDPAPIDGEVKGIKGGKAPRWVPSLTTWVGGSLAGTLRTGTPEMTRETYDAQISASISRGEAYKEELEETYSAVASHVGVSVDDLRVGEAYADVRGLGRRRGWNHGVGVVADWSRSVTA